jgi:hypothetical protein
MHVRKCELFFRMGVRKTEALTTLAGGIAHDFNKLLMGIQGRASLMLMNTDFSQPHYEDLGGIEDIVIEQSVYASPLLMVS